MEASTTALGLDPTLAEAHASYGIALFLSGDKQGAVAEFEKAIELDPDLYEVYYLYAYASRNSDDPEGAARMYRRAAELAPDDYRTALLEAAMLKDLGRISEFWPAARAGIERAERALAAHPDIPLPASLGAAMLATMGERARALEWAERAVTIAPEDPHTQFNVACTYALLNEPDRALDQIERWAMRANKETLRWLRVDSDFESLHDHPRFRRMLEQLD
jgi:adenylate cyclase